MNRISILFHLGKHVFKTGFADAEIKLDTRTYVQQRMLLKLTLKNIHRCFESFCLLLRAFFQKITDGVLLDRIFVQPPCNGNITHLAIALFVKCHFFRHRYFISMHLFTVLRYLCPEFRCIHLQMFCYQFICRRSGNPLLSVVLPERTHSSLEVLHMLVRTITAAVPVSSRSYWCTIQNTAPYMSKEFLFFVEYVVHQNIFFIHVTAPPLPHFLEHWCGLQ